MMRRGRLMCCDAVPSRKQHPLASCLPADPGTLDGASHRRRSTGKLYFSNQLGFHPGTKGFVLNPLLVGRLSRAQRRHLRVEFLEHRMREASADMADIVPVLALSHG